MTNAPDTPIAYGRLMHQAMRGLIQKVLSRVAEDGLPGDHHFFITFNTQAEGTQIADWLRERYPDEMTIVIQHWFDGLTVDDEGFDITLYFGEQPESLRIPFEALLTFVDPSVEFGLRFETRSEGEEELGSLAPVPALAAPERADDEDGPDDPGDDPGDDPENDPKDDPDGGGGGGKSAEAQVVSLEQFRKKQ